MSVSLVNVSVILYHCSNLWCFFLLSLEGLLDQLCLVLLPITVQCFRNIGTYLLNNPPILTQALTDMLITSYILFLLLIFKKKNRPTCVY